MDDEKIADENWELSRWNKDGTWIYEFWHRPIPGVMAGRHMKYTMENEEIIVIEDGPYLG